MEKPGLSALWVLIGGYEEMKNYVFKIASTLNDTKGDIPCLRIGQIIQGFHEYLETGKKIDPYYITDEKYSELLEDYCSGFLGRKRWRE